MEGRRHLSRQERRGEEGVASTVGVDLGGTRVRVGLLERDGTLTSKTEAPTEAWKGPEAERSP